VNRYVKLGLYALAGTVAGWLAYQTTRTALARRRRTASTLDGPEA
jgi:hypothetical protein